MSRGNMNEAAATGAGAGAAEAGTSSQPAQARRFPPAAQPEIMRAAEKDDQYATFLQEACGDVFRHLFGTRVSGAYEKEANLIGQTLYYVLTTGAGQQTLGEEYCDIIQASGSYSLPPTPARRALFIMYHTVIPYLTKRISARITARGINLSESREHARSYNLRGSTGQSSSSADPVTNGPQSTLSKLRAQLNRLWLWLVQKWPMVLPYAEEILQLLLRSNLMFFYFEGLYYHMSKRGAGIHYVFIGKPLNQRPRYQILGVFLLIQLCILGAEGLRRNRLSSFASSVNRSFQTGGQRLTGRGLPILNEEGNVIHEFDAEKGNWASDSGAGSEMQGTGTKGTCVLCLGPRQHPTATACGHVFCWKCITDACNGKPECPLCRTPITHSSLVCIYHTDF